MLFRSQAEALESGGEGVAQVHEEDEEEDEVADDDVQVGELLTGEPCIDQWEPIEYRDLIDHIIVAQWEQPVIFIK